jgi:hypothetical protein
MIFKVYSFFSHVKFTLQKVMQTLLFYVSLIFEPIVVFHNKLGPEHNKEDNRE